MSENVFSISMAVVNDTIRQRIGTLRNENKRRAKKVSELDKYDKKYEQDFDKQQLENQGEEQKRCKLNSKSDDPKLKISSPGPELCLDSEYQKNEIKNYFSYDIKFKCKIKVKITLTFLKNR